MSGLILAIDFGCARTKAAYFDERTGETRLVELSACGSGDIPSLFYVPKEERGAILVGEAAQAMITLDPEGVVSGLNIKWHLHKSGKILRGAGRRAIDRKSLVAELFRFVRERSQEKIGAGTRITRCCITVPAAFAQPQHEAVRKAAESGGFREITLTEESVTGSQIWAAESEAEEYILVCDMGRAGTGLSLVRRINDRFRTDENFPPFFLGSEDELQDENYLNRVTEKVSHYFKDCENMGATKPAIFLVGGSPRLDDLRRNLGDLKIGEIISPDNPGFAVVLGAATPANYRGLRKRIQLDLAEIQIAEREYLDLKQLLQRLSPKRALDWKQAASFGWPEAQWIVGMCHFENVPGWEHNKVTAARCFHEAAKTGFGKAIVSLAVCYSDGDGVLRDPGKAFTCWKAAVDSGEYFAKFGLALCYLDGSGGAMDTSKATQLLREDLHNPFSIWRLGLCYREGKGCEQDAAQAQALFELAFTRASGPAAKGAKFAQYLLGLSYLNAWGVDRDSERGVEWLSKSAHQGCADAQIALANCYSEGAGVQADPKRAIELVRTAAATGSLRGQIILGNSLLSGFGGPPDAVAAVEWFRKAAERGDPDGEYHFGRCLLQGTGTEQNQSEGFAWLMRAAQQNHALAEDHVGHCLLHGIGTEAEAESAILWLRKSAAQECANANYNLGLCYLRGNGVSKSREEAITHFKNAAQMEHLDSMIWLGITLCEFNTTIYSRQAVTWFQRAADQEHPGALFHLGYCNFEGIGTAKDERTGFLQLQRAAEMGYDKAQSFIGDCYYAGIYVSANGAAAANWYRKAAEQGSHQGAIGLGKCYLDGYGVTRDIPLAAKWLQPAADAGYPESMTNLGKCYASGLL
ncbi:MAG: uncharacterized protein JWM16_4354 [Verrucomicrobiales bacterium]|nr:uncharacterized protein [Verrucomicrobiales bacterium]